MTAFEVRRSTFGDMTALSATLAAEFDDQVSAGTVIRAVAKAREQLLAAGVRAGLVAAVESMTRARLASLGSEAADKGAAVPPAYEPTYGPSPGRAGPHGGR